MMKLCIILALVAIVSVARAKPSRYGRKDDDEEKNLFYDDFWTKRYIDDDGYSNTKYSPGLHAKWQADVKPKPQKQLETEKKTDIHNNEDIDKKPEIEKKVGVKSHASVHKKDLDSKHSDQFAQKSLKTELSLNDKIYDYAEKLQEENKPWDFAKFEEDYKEQDYKEIDDEITQQQLKKSDKNTVVPNKHNSFDDEDDKNSVKKSYGNDMLVPDSNSDKREAERGEMQTEVQEVHPIVFDDAAPVKSDKHHSVKKNLYGSEYLKEYAKTKPDLKTSPNPPPPGLGSEHSMMVTPSGKKLKMSKKDPVYIESIPLEKCAEDYDCRIGRRCHKGTCVCLDDTGCRGHYKPVCGSDGQWYPSHCELHRTACVRRNHIKIDHRDLCLKSNDKNPDEKEDEKLPVDPLLKIDTALPHAAFSHSLKNSAEIHDDDKAALDTSTPDKKPDDKEDKSDKPETVKAKKNDVADLKIMDNSFDEYLKDSSEKEKKCDNHEYHRFKEILLKFHCSRFAEKDCNTQTHDKRDYLATLMFSIYDMNLDYYIDMREAAAMEKKEGSQRNWSACNIMDIIRRADLDPVDNKLSVSEFVGAFNIEGLSQPVTVVVREEFLPTLATVGNGLELKCGVADGRNIIWKRNGVNLKELPTEELQVFEDGALYFSKVGVHHMGNYSCEDRTDPSVRQVHSLKVHMPPIVRVSPTSQMRVSKSDITIKCHAEGIPTPKVTWQVNEVRIPDLPQHFIKTHANGTLTVHNADFQRDTGAYKCVGENQAGVAEGVASVFIQDPHNKKNSYPSYHKSLGTFLVFHEKGYTAYDPTSCLIRRDATGQFGSFKFIPDNLDAPLRLCDPGIGCRWGGAVNINNQFVYVSQPAENRVIVIETSHKWNPIQVIDTDKTPVHLHYIAHLDQVWVLCWNGDKDGSTKTIVVIRDASKYIQHHAVHTQPVGNRFDLVQDLFLPPSNDLHHEFHYGYVTHSGQEELFKLDLRSMKYINTIDVSQYDCVPKTLAFVPIGGHVIIQCVSPETHASHLLILDYVTDAVVMVMPTQGKPYVSPDSRHVVTVDSETGKVFVNRVSEQGSMESAFELTVSTNIGDVTFFPSTLSKGYDLVLTSSDNNDIIFVILANGKVEKVKGTGTKDFGDRSSWKPSPVIRRIASGNIFSDYLMTPLESSVRIIDGKHHHMHCEFSGPHNSHVVLFVEN